MSSRTGEYPFERETDRVWIYDVPADKWRTKPGLPSDRARGCAAAVRRGNWIYVVTGNRGGHDSHAQSLTWMDAYNWRTGKWTSPGRFPNMPGAGRDHTVGALVNDELCVASVRNGGTKNFFTALIRTNCYNFKSNKWSKRGNFPKGWCYGCLDLRWQNDDRGRRGIRESF